MSSQRTPQQPPDLAPPEPQHPMPRRPPRPPINRWHVAAVDLIDEIVTAAECIGSAREPTGERVYPDDASSRLLRVLEKSHCCLAIADVGRALHVSRQAAHKLVYRAAAAGRVEILTNHQDRRILQVLLTPAGRFELKGSRAAELGWLPVLLSGLHDRDLATTTHVLRIIRQRLQRDARDLARRKQLRLKSADHWGNRP